MPIKDLLEGWNMWFSKLSCKSLPDTKSHYVKKIDDTDRQNWPKCLISEKKRSLLKALDWSGVMRLVLGLKRIIWEKKAIPALNLTSLMHNLDGGVNLPNIFKNKYLTGKKKKKN